MQKSLHYHETHMEDKYCRTDLLVERFLPKTNYESLPYESNFLNRLVLLWNLHVTYTCGSNFIVRCPAVGSCPLHECVIFCHTVFCDENSCPLLGGVCCIEVSVNGDSTAHLSLD